MPLGVTRTAEEGDPEYLRAEARELRTVVANIRSVSSMLRTISTKGVWDSCSGTAFAGEVDKTPDMLVKIADRLADAERIVRQYADRLEEDQKYLTQQRERYERYVRISDGRKARLDSTPPEDPQYMTYDRQYVVAANERQWAKERYIRRNDHALDDEMTVGRRLASVGADLADPDGYNAFEMSSHVGTSSLVNNPVVAFSPGLKVLSALAVGDPIGQLGRRAMYDEGSYRGVAKNSAGTVVSAIIGRRGGAGAAANATKRSRRLADDVAAAKKRYPTTSTTSVATTRWTQRATTSVRRTTATTAVRARHRAVDKLADKSGVRLIDDMAADWATLAGSGHVRKGKHIVTYTVASGATAKEHVDSARTVASHVDRATGANPEDKAQARREAARKSRESRHREERLDQLTEGPVPLTR